MSSVTGLWGLKARSWDIFQGKKRRLFAYHQKKLRTLDVCSGVIFLKNRFMNLNSQSLGTGDTIICYQGDRRL